MIAGSLEVQMSANVAKLAEDMGKAKAIVGDAAKGIEQVISQTKGVLASLGIGLTIKGFADMVQSAAESADQASKLGARFGIAAEQITAMQHAADLAGISSDGLQTALRGLSKSAVEAATKGGDTWMAFQRLGLSAEELIKLPLDQQFKMVIDRLGTIENASVRNATALKVFTRNASEMIGLVAEGSEAFQKAQKDVEAWGLALNAIDSAKIELANDAMKRASAATKGFFTQVALAIAPGVKALADYFADTKAAANGYRKEIVEGTDEVVNAIGYVMNVLRGLQYAWVFLKEIIGQVAGVALDLFSNMAGAIAKLAGWAEKLPGPLGEAAKNIKEFAAESQTNLASLAQGFYDASEAAQQQLQELVDKGLPHDQIVAAFQRARKTIADEAAKIVEIRKNLNSGGGEGLGQIASAYDIALANQLTKVVESNKTQLEVVKERYDREQAILNEAAEKEFIDNDFWQGQSMLLFASYEKEKTRLLDEETKKRYGIANVYRELDLNSAGYFFGVLAQMMSSHSKTMFGIGKAAAISETIIKTYQAAQGAYASLVEIPFVGPALATAAAAAAIVAGIARVQQIRSTQFGSGSVSSGGGGTFSVNPSTGAPTAPIVPGTGVSPAPATQINVQIITHGNIIGDQGIEQLVTEKVIPVVSDAINNRDVQIIDRNSRQAQTLAAVSPPVPA